MSGENKLLITCDVCVADCLLPVTNFCKIFCLHAGSPKILEQKNPPVAKDGVEFSVSCKLVKGNPLPTFKWQYASQNLDCDIFERNCYPTESQWKPIPPQLITPASATPTNESIVKVDSHQPNTFYRCQAFNKFGNDSQVLRFFRRGKNVAVFL